jgi:DNA-binding NarL/FixJ family response regulator
MGDFTLCWMSTIISPTCPRRGASRSPILATTVFDSWLKLRTNGGIVPLPEISQSGDLLSSTNTLIRILTVDDHPLLRKGIAALVDVEPDMKLVAEASNGQEAIDKFRLLRPDVTLMDLQMPDMSGIEAIIRIHSEFPNARIVVLTTYTGDAQVLRALKAGARAYILKGHVHRELLETIRAVHAGQKRIPPDVAGELAQHASDDALSSREIDVLRLIAAGNSNKLIADQLSIGEATVKSHVTNILSKLGANDRSHAVTIGLKRGIIEL